MKISHLTSYAGGLQGIQDMKSKMSTAISKLQTTDPALAKKLTSINTEAQSLTKSGMSMQDALSRAEKDNGSLSSDQKVEIAAALGGTTTSGTGAVSGNTTDSLASLMSSLSSGSGVSGATTSSSSLMAQVLANRYGTASNTAAGSLASILGASGLTA